jgi:hypothetical protein
MNVITPAMWLTIGLFAVNLIFMAGGFCWLAMNHFRSVNKRLEKLESGQGILAAALEYIRGRIDEGFE